MASMAARLAQLERSWHIGGSQRVRIIFPIVHPWSNGTDMPTECYLSCTPFEFHGAPTDRDMVTPAMIDGWAKHDRVIVISDPLRADEFTGLPCIGEWPDLAPYIQAGDYCQWRDYERGSTWARYCALKGITAV